MCDFVCRYRSYFDKNVEFAQLVQQKLVAYKADDPSMGDVSVRDIPYGWLVIITTIITISTQGFIAIAFHAQFRCG